MRNTIYSVSKVSRVYPDRIAYINGENSVSYSTIWRNTLCLYNYFISAQVTLGVYLWINISDAGIFLSAVMAAYMVGANCCLISEDIYFEPNRQKEISGPTSNLMNDDIIIEDCVTLAEVTKPVLFISDKDDFPFHIDNVAYENITVRLRESVDRVFDVKTIPKENDESQIIFFTSATTSSSKAVVSKYGQFNFAELELGNQAPVINAITRNGYIKPFFCSEASTLQEGNAIMSVDIKNDEELLRLADHKVDHLLTNLYGTKRFIYIAQKYNVSYPQIQTVTITGGAINSTYKRKIEKIFPNAMIVDLYGQTELGSISSIDNTEWLESPYCVGRPSFFTKVQIMRDNQILPEGEIGDICVRSRFAFAGYLNHEKHTQEYVVTGDLGYLINNELFYLGRKSEKIDIGNKMIFARQIEEVILKANDDVDMAVFVRNNKFFIYVAEVEQGQIALFNEAIINFEKELDGCFKIILTEEIAYSKNQKPVMSYTIGE